MTLHARDPIFGHEAIFLAASPLHSRHLSDVIWGSSSISVPSSSPLNGTADVWLRLPKFSAEKAQRWCLRRNATFLGPWHPSAASPQPAVGFGFRVHGFSRYRYVESDDEADPDEPLGEPDLDDSGLTASARRRARTHAAGRTPVRPAARAARSPGRTPAVKKNRPALTPTPRRRMTPSVAMYDSDDDDVDDAITTEDTQADDPETDDPDVVDLRDPFAVVEFGGGIDAPRLSRESVRHLREMDTSKRSELRAAMFGEHLGLGMIKSPNRAYAAATEPQGEDEDVAMEDAPVGDEAEDDGYDIFDGPAHRDAGPYGDVDAPPEAGIFLVDGEVRRRRPATDAFFPSTSLPFPTVEGSVAAGKEGIISDTGLMLGRSTRISFSHTGMMVRPCYGKSGGDPFAPPGFMTDVVGLFAGSVQVPRSSFSKLLRVHCVAWYGDAVPLEDGESEKGTGVRTPTLEGSFSCPYTTNETIRSFIQVLEGCYTGNGDVNALHAQIALSMLFALYKKEVDQDALSGDNLLTRISFWAAGAAGTAFDDAKNCSATGLRSAVINLSLGKIEEAVSSATKAGHLRLSLLIARALESPKDDLRADAEAQLATCGLSRQRDEEEYTDDENVTKRKDWDVILEECSDSAAVSRDERMILLILAGHVAPVARFLGLSWYRLFIMEFFHGAGSSDLTQAERVSAAVQVIASSGISTLAPHGCAQDTDVVYHLLCLYAEPTASYSLTSGVYASGSFGSVYSPLDARFSWLTYQLLTAVIPQASTPKAPQMLADEFSSQLRAAGLHLWSFYVLCSSNPSPYILKSNLIRDWPYMMNDFVEWKPSHGLNPDRLPKVDRVSEVQDGKVESAVEHLGAEQFLEEVLRVPKEWIAEANAVVAHLEGEYLEECKYWLASRTEYGASRALEHLANQVFPSMVSCQDSSRYGEVVEVLRQLEVSKHVADWSISGGLILNYLEHVVGVPTLKRQPLAVYRGMVSRVRAWGERASTPEQHYTATVIADGILAAERAQLFYANAEDRNDILAQVIEDLDRLPCSKGVKLRAMSEYLIESKDGSAVALRFSAAFPPYARFLDSVETAEG